MTDYARIAKQVAFLKDYPEYDEMPATIAEFLGPEYLNLDAAIRPGLRKALIDIFGNEVNPNRISKYERAMFTGAIGIGKTTFSSIAIPYMVHHTLCLRDPQRFYGLMPGRRIAFMQMSTSSKQALEVVFGDLKATIQASPWFINNYPFDDKFEKQMRFAKDIWILPGGSEETQFEGYNILGGILEEMDSHKQTADKDYADVGYETIHSRIASRFTDFSDVEDMGHRGLLICIGQMKKSTGFAARKYAEFLNDAKAYVIRMTIWESFGWERYTRKDGTRASFWYNTKSKKIVPTLVADMVQSNDLVEVPNAYRKDFENNPEKALRDLAGIPPATTDPFISLVDRIEECRDKWVERVGHDTPVGPEVTRVKFEDWFRGNGDQRKRAIHLDFATSGNGDALGLGMGYIDHLVTIEDEEKPYIIFDCLIRFKARPGDEIMLSDVRTIIYNLKEELGFKVVTVTMDGFQSTDTQQQLRKKRFHVDYLSVDKSSWPYEDLRDAIYERRVEFPKYLTYLRIGDTQKVEIAVRELMELSYDGKKVDHPPSGSKDVADTMAGVVHTLMGDRSYRRGVRSVNEPSDLSEVNELEPTGTTGTGLVLPFPSRMKLDGLKAPLPPTIGGALGLTIPDRLKPR